MNFTDKMSLLGNTLEREICQLTDDNDGFIGLAECAYKVFGFSGNESESEADRAATRIRREIRRSYFLTLERGKRRASTYNGVLFNTSAEIELHYSGIDPEVVKKSTGLYFPAPDDANTVQAYIFSRCLNDMSLKHGDIVSDLKQWCRNYGMDIGAYISNDNLFYKIKQSAKKCLIAQGKYQPD